MSFQSVVTNEPVAKVHNVPVSSITQSSYTNNHVLPEVPNHDRTEAKEVLRVLDLRKHFRSGFLRKKQRGIHGVSFTVNKGECFAILGHNGAGKTTTINCILDLVHPQGGEVQIFGASSQNIQSRSKVGYLPERPYFFEHLTGRELLKFYGKLLEVPSDLLDLQIQSILKKTTMTADADRPLRKYSKGMLQRIGLAQALLGDPELLVMDEPMSGLDPVGRKQVRQLLQELKADGKTIILSSHIVPDVEMLADRVGIMCEGRLAKVCDMAQLASESSYEIRISEPESALGYRLMNVENVQKLTQTLEQLACSGHDVMAVETRRSGLEDLFMQIHQQRKEL